MTTETEAVVETSAPEVSESIQAGYDRIANPGKDQAKESEAKAQITEVKEEPPTAETPPETTFTSDQIKGVMAQVSRIPELEKRLRDEGGRYGALKQTLDQLQQKLTTATSNSPADVEEMLKDIKDEVGDDSPFYLSLKAAFSKVMTGKSVDPETIEKMVSEKIEATKKAEMASAQERLTEAHPTWYQDRETPEFKEWKTTLSDRQRSRFERSNDPDFVAENLDQFQEWKAAKAKAVVPTPQPKPVEAKPSARLLKAVMPTNGAKPKAAGEDDAKSSIRAGYERVAGARIR